MFLVVEQLYNHHCLSVFDSVCGSVVMWYCSSVTLFSRAQIGWATLTIQNVYTGQLWLLTGQLYSPVFITCVHPTTPETAPEEASWPVSPNNHTDSLFFPIINFTLETKFDSHWHTQSGIVEKYWHEHCHCSCGHDIFQTFNIMNNQDCEVQNSGCPLYDPDHIIWLQKELELVLYGKGLSWTPYNWKPLLQLKKKLLCLFGSL